VIDPVAAFPPAYLQGLLGDAEAEAALSDTALIEAMLSVETALAAAQAEVGEIPAEAAATIANAVKAFKPDMAALTSATERDGVVVPGLVAQVRASCDGSARHHLHWGATSQDIADTAMALCLRRVIDLCDARLDNVIAALMTLADRHRDTVMAARTRGQHATPTTFGLKAAGWMLPLVRWRKRMNDVRADALVLSFGGATGTAGAYGPKARQIETALAKRLDLALAPMPTHTQRDGMVVLGGWYAGVAGSLAKLAGDVQLLAQSEIGELRIGGAGGSSTMPNKRNPTRAEAILALADRTSTQIGALHRTAAHEHERGGAAWMAEWQALPDLAVIGASALRHTMYLLEALEVDAAAMRGNVEASNGLLLAEAASFLLAGRMSRPDAQALVKDACAETARTGRHLFDVLAGRCDDAIDWAALRDPARHLGDAHAMVDRALAEARNTISISEESPQ
jgi:3-carboxy-cis,cis-muconate cycloisomerase